MIRINNWQDLSLIEDDFRGSVTPGNRVEKFYIALINASRSRNTLKFIAWLVWPVFCYKFHLIEF